MKKPNSRRDRRENRRGHNSENDALARARQEVGIDFVCRRRDHDTEIVGRFRMSTADDDDRRVQVVAMSGGRIPEEKGRPGGEAKALMICPTCGHEREVSIAKLAEALNALWAPRHARVVAHEV